MDFGAASVSYYAPVRQTLAPAPVVEAVVGLAPVSAPALPNAVVSYYNQFPAPVLTKEGNVPSRFEVSRADTGVKSRDQRREELMKASSAASTAPCRSHNRAIVAAADPDQVFAVFERYGSGFDGVNYSTALTRLAKFAAAGVRADAARLQHLRAAAGARLDAFAMRNVCSIAWSLGKLGIRDQPMLAAVAGLVTERFRLLSPKDVGIVAWGFASTRYRHTPSLSAIGAMAIEHRELLEPAELANVVWGFATLQFRQGQVMHKLASVFTEAADAYQAKEMANVLWSYSSLSYRDDHETRTDSPLFTKVGDLLAKRIEDFDAQGLTNLVWSYANILHKAPSSLMQGCACRIDRVWAELKPQEVANALWVFERLGDPALASVAAARMERHELSLDSWSGEQLSKLVASLELQLPGSLATGLARAAFEARLLNPVCEFLGSLGPSVSRQEYVQKLRAFELFHLGPTSTPRALAALNLVFLDVAEEAAFRERAIEALLQFYLFKANALAVREVAMLTGGQTTSRWIAAEVEYDLRGPRGNRAGHLTLGVGASERPGRVLPDFGDLTAALRDSSASVAAEWLWSVTLAGDVGRSSHCEYVALAEHVVDCELRALGLGSSPRVSPEAEFTGEVRLFTTHYPCLSCVGVLAQFRARFPYIKVSVSFLEWRDWQLEMRRAIQRRREPPR